MARGYMPGISGLQQNKVDPNLIKAQVASNTRRALQRLLSSHKHHVVSKELLTPGRKTRTRSGRTEEDPARDIGDITVREEEPLGQLTS